MSGQTQVSKGGGIYSVAPALTLSEATVTGNAAGSGGGLFVYYGSSATIHNCTFAGNSASVSGGGLFVEPPAWGSPLSDVKSTIFSENRATQNPDLAGPITSSHNLFQEIGDASPNIIGDGTDIVGRPALLGRFGFHDGGTTQTTLPARNSPAVLNGPGVNIDSLSQDQNG